MGNKLLLIAMVLVGVGCTKKAAIAEFKAGLPAQVEKLRQNRTIASSANSQLVDVMLVNGDTVQFHQRYQKPTTKEDLDRTFASVRENQVKHACNGFAPFLKHETNIQFIYYGPDNKKLTEQMFTPEDCTKAGFAN